MSLERHQVFKIKPLIKNFFFKCNYSIKYWEYGRNDFFRFQQNWREKPMHIDSLANFRGTDFFHLTFETLVLTSHDPKWPAILVKFSWSECKQCDCSYLAAFCRTRIPFSIPLKEKQNIGNWSHPKSVIFYES